MPSPPVSAPRAPAAGRRAEGKAAQVVGTPQPADRVRLPLAVSSGVLWAEVGCVRAGGRSSLSPHTSCMNATLCDTFAFNDAPQTSPSWD